MSDRLLISWTGGSMRLNNKHYKRDLKGELAPKRMLILLRKSGEVFEVNFKNKDFVMLDFLKEFHQKGY